MAGLNARYPEISEHYKKVVIDMNTKMLVMAILLPLSVSAHASCKAADLAGTWYASGMSGDFSAEEIDTTDQCKFTLSNTGAISGTSGSCKFYGEDGRYSGKITTGKFTISSNCDVSGTITECEGSDCYQFIIERSRMDRSKSIMALLGYVKAYPTVVFSYTALKQ